MIGHLEVYVLFAEAFRFIFCSWHLMRMVIPAREYLPTDNTNKRAPELNKYLATLKHPSRLEQKKLPGKCGWEPYVASKAAFRVLYDFF